MLGGIAELIAGAISMGIGGFLASQAERDHFRFLKRHTSARVLRSCVGEMEREVYAILGSVGVDERTAQAVTRCLLNVECDTSRLGANGGSEDEEQQQLIEKEDVGVTPFLLKFGEGLGAYIVQFDLLFSNVKPISDRGSADQAALHFCCDHRSWLLGRWDHSPHAVLLHQPRPRRFTLFLSSHWCRLASLRRSKSPCYGCW